MHFFGDVAQQVRKAALQDDEPNKNDYEVLHKASSESAESVSDFDHGVESADNNEQDMNVKRGLLGLKRITLFGSIVCVANNIAGPGMVVLPRVYQEAGWVVPSAVLVLVCVASSLAATYLVDAMARIPGNSRFQRRIEFVNIFDEYWGPNGMRVAQFMFIINMMAQVMLVS